MEKLTVGLDDGLWEIVFDVTVTAGLGTSANYIVQEVMPWDLAFYLRMALSKDSLDWIENIVAGIENAVYGKISKCLNID